MRLPLIVSAIISTLSASVLSGQVIEPESLDKSIYSEIPYSYVGQLRISGGTGSASTVARGVIATAAHVIYDSEALVWEPIASVNYLPQNWKNDYLRPGSGRQYKMVAFLRWTTYADRTAAEGGDPNTSTYNTFNLDFATGYVASFVTRANMVEHPEVNFDLEETVGILREDRDKTIVGYPTDSDFISSAAQNTMHQTQPADYYIEWFGITDIEQTWRDSENFWFALYDVIDVNSYGGNSGGPIYIRDDEDKWVMAGVLVGGGGGNSVLIRGVDEEAWRLIDDAYKARGVNPILMVEDLAGQRTGPGTIELGWSDLSSEEAGYDIYRQETGVWERIATIGADSTSYVDSSAMPGQFYNYRVQPFAENGNKPPKGNVARVAAWSANTAPGALFGQSWLKYSNDGYSNWYVDGNNRLRAGKVRPLSESILAMDIIGPGTISFDWSVSSEENPDYDTPGSTNFREIYDAVILNLNGNPVFQTGEEVFLSGFAGPVTRSVQIPAGPHTVEWIYEKDPYSTEGDDTAYLDAVRWIPASSNPYPISGAFDLPDSELNDSLWFGRHYSDGSPYVYHPLLGWLKATQGDSDGVYMYGISVQADHIYTHPDIFPFLYDYAQGAWRYFDASENRFLPVN